MPTMTTTKNVLAAPWSSAQKSNLPKSSFAWVDSDGKGHLPYKDPNGKVDLPHVRNALARLNQVDGMTDAERSSVKAKLQSALKNTKASDDTIMRAFSAIQASNDSTLPTEVELLREGTFNTEKYGPIPLKASDLEEMDANFKAGIGMAHNGQTGIPIDYAHESGKNAAAWIKGTRVDRDDEGLAHLMGTDLEFSTSGRAAILGKEYKCLSSDFYPEAFGEWVDPESGVSAKNVIVGAALTNRPMFTGNQPLLASEMDDDEGGITTIININATENNKESDMDLSKVRVKAANEVSGEEQRFLQTNVAELNADEQKKFELVVPQKQTSDAKVIKASEVTGTEGEVRVQAADLKAQNDKIAGLTASVESLQANDEANKKEKAKSIVAEAIGKGKIVADQSDKWEGLILADASNVELLENLPENKLLGTKQGASGAQASDKTGKEQLLDKAKELVAAAPSDKPLGIQAAMEKVSADPANKELVDRVAEDNRALAGVTGAVA